MYDSTDITKSSADVTIKMATINTGNPDRDKHLMSPDFFDAEKYPDITFKSSKIEKKGRRPRYDRHDDHAWHFERNCCTL